MCRRRLSPELQCRPRRRSPSWPKTRYPRSASRTVFLSHSSAPSGTGLHHELCTDPHVGFPGKAGVRPLPVRPGCLWGDRGYRSPRSAPTRGLGRVQRRRTGAAQRDSQEGWPRPGQLESCPRGLTTAHTAGSLVWARASRRAAVRPPRSEQLSPRGHQPWASVLEPRASTIWEAR